MKRIDLNNVYFMYPATPYLPIGVFFNLKLK